MKRSMVCMVLSLVITVGVPSVKADSTQDLLEEAISLLNEGNTAEAREVLAIALDQIDHDLLDSTAALFPESVGAYTRGEVDTQKAMGMDITECTYRSEEGNEVEVQLMGGGGGMLGSLADLGASFGGGRKVRIQGRSGTAMEDDGETTLMLKLKSGKSLSFTSRSLDRDAVTTFAEAFPVKEIDESGM